MSVPEQLFLFLVHHLIRFSIDQDATSYSMPFHNGFDLGSDESASTDDYS